MLPKLAFIGTGIMGGPMACNLLKAGYTVCVHNRSRAKAQPAIDAGASWADSHGQAACNADVILTCLPDTPDVQQVLLGPDGVIHSAKAGAICIDHSTISPKATEEIAAVFQQRAMTFLDAPVSGGQKGAIEAKLSIMVGGPKETLETVRPILAAMGTTITHCGPAGCGQMTKLTNQIMAIHTVLSAAEGLAFAKRAGLNLETTLAAISAGAASSRSLVNLGPKMIAGDFAPAFKVDLQLKDLRLVQETAREIGQPLPATALATELLQILAAQNRGSDGTQALYEIILSLGRKT
jgi:3-hydroxyisobutyrate dehydrogenase